MQKLIDKLKNVEWTLSREHGPFDLFAVLERDDIPGRYDLVVAAPWLPADMMEALTLLYTAIKDNLGPDEMRLIARIVPLNQNDEVLGEIRQAFERSSKSIDRIHFGNVNIRGGIALRH